MISQKDVPIHDLTFSSALNQDCSRPMTCSICAADIPDHIPEYFFGIAVNSACTQCKNNFVDDDMTPDPFDSFFESVMPTTMVSHWTPAFSNCEQNLLYITLPESSL